MTVKDKRTQMFQDRCRALRPLLGKQADAFWTAYLFQNEQGKCDLEDQIELLVNAKLNGDVENTAPIFHPPSPEKAAGGIPLGSVHYNGQDMHPFGITETEASQHISICGRSGSGKSNTAYVLARNLTLAGIPWLCLDWKQSWRRLRNVPGLESLRVFTVGRDVAPLRINPLIPPAGIDPKNWLRAVVDLILKAYFCGDGVGYLLVTILDELYTKHGVYTGNVERYPTFHDVMARLKTMPAAGRVSLWLSSAIRAVHALCFGSMDGIVNAGTNISMDDLLGSPAVLELEALGHADKLFVSELLMLQIYTHRLLKNERNQLKHILIIEEAHHLLSRMGQRSGQPSSIVEMIFREIRELSEGIAFLDQMPSEISRTALANTYTTVAMNLKGKQDVATMSAAMLLRDDQAFALGTMPVGNAIVKLQGRTPEPFMIHIPEMIIPPDPVTDDIISEAMARYISMPSNGIPDNEIHTGENPALSMAEKSFLQDVALLPDSGVAARYRRLSVSCRQGEKIRHSLLDLGLIEEAEKLSPTGKTRIIRLTEKGKSWVQNHLAEDSGPDTDSGVDASGNPKPVQSQPITDDDFSDKIDDR